MAKKLSEQPTSVLIHAQQVIQMASEEMHNFFGHVDKEHKEGKVSTSYHTRLEQSLRTKIEANNTHVEKIDKEVFSRIENYFPGATTPKVMKLLVPGYEKEKSEHTKKEAPAKKEKPVLEMNKSREKKV